MKVQVLFFVALIVYTSIIQASAVDQYSEEYDDEYYRLKRFLLGQKSPSTPSPSEICASDPCENGGICFSKGQTTYNCKCIGPWRGIYCGVADACYNSPCQNGGTCLNVYDDYWCKCTNDYYGKNCQTSFRTRNILKRRSYYKLLDHIQQASGKQKDIAEDGKAYYDYRNGIYY